MQWSAIVGIVIFVFFVGVKGILAFSFCAVVSFIFARNLLDGANDLDFTRFFTSKGLGLAKKKKFSSVARRSFPRGLKTCRHALIRNILRDFVISWYENVGISGDFILETRSFLEKATVNFYDKLVRTSVGCHTQKLCVLLHRHLGDTQTAKLAMSKNHKNFVETYRSLKKEDCAYKIDQLQYLRNVLDLLLYKLVTPRTLGCNTGRFILREILAVKLMMPLVDKISDPDFVNTSIINILGENNDENLITTSKDNETTKSNLNVSNSFTEYLNENFELNDNNQDKKSHRPGSGTRYKFKGATVVEKEDVEIIELSMEVTSQENNDSSNCFEHDNSTQGSKTDTTAATFKTNESRADKTSNCLAEEQSHSSNILNGLSKVKNEKLKPNKEKSQNSKLNSILSAKISSGGTILTKQFRKIHSFPVMKQNTIPKLEESASKGENISRSVSDCNDDTEFLKDGAGIPSSSHHDRSVNFGSEGDGLGADGIQTSSRSKPKFISGPVKRESVSSYEEVGIHDNNTEEFDSLGSCDSSKDFQIFEEQKFARSNDRNTKPNPVTKNPRHHTKSCSSTDEWDSEVFEKMDDELIIDTEDDFIESDGLVLKPGPTDNDVVSKADFAVHDMPNPSSLINIPSTELVTDHTFEPYKSKYTVYVIEYDKQLWQCFETDNHLEKQESSETDTQSVIKRRYREFMELHHRLVCGPFAKLMKDIPKPNRKFNSPFFRLDQDVVEGRQLLLENYLKCLVAKSAILNSEDFKGFLGIGDESHTDFRRVIVPTLPQVPRIDKKLQKKVTKIIDHIKTAFDTGPIDGDKEEEYDDIRKVLGEDKTSQDDIRTFAICSGGCNVSKQANRFNLNLCFMLFQDGPELTSAAGWGRKLAKQLSQSCCYSDSCFHTFIQQQYEVTQPGTERPTQQQTKESPATNLGSNSCENGPASKDLNNGRHLQSCNDVNSSKVPGKQSASSNTFDNSGFASTDLQDTTNPLTRTVLNLSCHLLENHESWLCLEPVQQAATAVFGCFFEWWIDSLLSELVTEEQWKFYLTLLTDTIWPEGELMNSSVQEKSEEERLKTKEEAIATLSNFCGVVLHATVGSKAIEYSAREIVESFQHAEINRQVLMDILEVILAEVFPELIDEKDFYISSRNC